MQYFIKIIPDFPLGPPNKVNIAAKAVKVTGIVDSATINAIRAIQESARSESPGTVVDGRVSPVRVNDSYGGGFWTIVRLNNNVQQRFLNFWPRLDMIPGCPGEIKALVVRTVAGT